MLRPDEAGHDRSALTARRRGRLYVGTSGFAYPGWSPRFYPAGLRAAGFLAHYASRLAAVELNNTYYQQPKPDKVDAWLAATPPTFRFTVKAQRGGSFRTMTGRPDRERPVADRAVPRVRGAARARSCFASRTAASATTTGWRRCSAAWPRDLPLTMEFQDPSWHVDETFAALAAAGAALCTTELPEDATRRRSGGPARSCTCACAATTTRPTRLDAWATRLEPFLAAGDDAFVFFRHDEVGSRTGAGAALAEAVAAAHLSARCRADQPRDPSAGPNDHEQLEPLGDVVERVRHVRRPRRRATRGRRRGSRHSTVIRPRPATT